MEGRAATLLDRDGPPRRKDVVAAPSQVGKRIWLGRAPLLRFVVYLVGGSQAASCPGPEFV